MACMCTDMHVLALLVDCLFVALVLSFVYPLHLLADVFRDRLIVAVTKFDTQYTTNPCESDDVLSMDDVKQVTVEYIRKAVGPGVPVSEDIVVPLSGLWAHTARELAKYPPRNYQYDESHSSHRFLRIAKEYLQKYPSSTGGECDHGAALDILQSEEIADRLEEASGIRELEARYHCE